MNWQPIETAPNEHLIFYGNTRYGVGVVFTGWKARNGICYADSGEMAKPTYWMPTPKPPPYGEDRG